MMHPLCLSVVEKSIKDKKTDIQNIIRNLCTTDSPEPRFPDLVREHAPFNDHIVNPDCRIDYFALIPRGNAMDCLLKMTRIGPLPCSLSETTEVVRVLCSPH